MDALNYLLSRNGAAGKLIAALLLNPSAQAVATIDHCQPLNDAQTDFAHVFEELEAITAAVTMRT